MEDDDENIGVGKRKNDQKGNRKKEKNRKWDAAVVAIGMVIGFSVIIMKITGYWPCNIISTLQIKQITCSKSIQENVSSIIHWIQQQYQGRFFSHFLSQVLQSI
jgi:hypothetical protein